MSVKSKTGSPLQANDTTILFGQRYAASENFMAVFEEGMGLVEATAAYLDGDGRKESKALEPTVSLAYATESMRLTTRLMQLASWLLIRRAVNEGEMTSKEACEEQNKVKFQPVASTTDEATYAALPVRLRELNELSIALHRRVIAIDNLLKAEIGADSREPENGALGEQLSRLKEAFGPMIDMTRNEDSPSGDSV